jgi:hypothetical protein
MIPVRSTTCERPRPFQLVLHYRIFHLYWILRAVTSRRYVRMCTVCSRGPEVDRAYAESGLGGDRSRSATAMASSPPVCWWDS